MQAVDFDRDAMAAWYAEQHLDIDPGLQTVYYLPAKAPEREIRLLEVNHLMGEMRDDLLEPFDFGVEAGQDVTHRLFVLDVTPAQWERIRAGQIPLPAGWSLDDVVEYAKN